MNDPDPFYLLSDKVWVGRFQQFAEEQPGAVKADNPQADASVNVKFFAREAGDLY